MHLFNWLGRNSECIFMKNDTAVLCWLQDLTDRFASFMKTSKVFLFTWNFDYVARDARER